MAVSTKDSFKRRREKEAAALAKKAAAEQLEEIDVRLPKRPKPPRPIFIPKALSSLTKLDQKRDLKLMLPAGAENEDEEAVRLARPAVLRAAERPAVPHHSTQEEKKARAIRWQAGAEEIDEEMATWDQAVQDTTKALESTESEAEQHRQAHVCLREHLMEKYVALQEQNELCDDVQAALLRQVAAELAKDGSAPPGLDHSSLFGAGSAAEAEYRSLMESALSALQLRAGRVQAAVAKQPQQRSKGSASASAIAAAAAAARSKQAYLAAEAAAAAAAAADCAAATSGERAAATPFGDGTITDIRADGAVVVQLAYGTAYLQPAVAVDLSDSAAAAPPVPPAQPELPSHSPGLPFLTDADLLQRWGRMDSDLSVLGTLSAEAVALARVSGDAGAQQLRQLLPAPRVCTQMNSADSSGGSDSPFCARSLLDSGHTATVRERALPTVEVEGTAYTREWVGGAVLKDGAEPPKHMTSASVAAAATAAAAASGASSGGGSFKERYHSEEDTSGGGSSSSGARRSSSSSSSSRSVTEDERAAQRQLVATLNTVRDAADGQHTAQQVLAIHMDEVRFDSSNSSPVLHVMQCLLELRSCARLQW
jgi:hypothetical protein